jgi:hypothetical protein
MTARLSENSGVLASCPFSVRMSPSVPPFLDHPLERRMTQLQRAALHCLQSMKQSQAEIFDLVFHQMGSPVYLASAFGEFGSFLAESRLINARSLPVSPAAFQHSVQNCALGYFSILNGLHTGHLAISSGPLSLDKAIHLAFSQIEAGALQAVCIVAAEEIFSDESGWLSVAESFVLHRSAFSLASPVPFVLESMRCDLGSGTGAGIGRTGEWQSVPFLGLGERTDSFVRHQFGPFGEHYESRWSVQPCAALGSELRADFGAERG